MPVSSPPSARLCLSLGCERIQGHRVAESGTFTRPACGMLPTWEKLPMVPSLPGKKDQREAPMEGTLEQSPRI